jgi:hypothetical protein
MAEVADGSIHHDLARLLLCHDVRCSPDVAWIKTRKMTAGIKKRSCGKAATNASHPRPAERLLLALQTRCSRATSMTRTLCGAAFLVTLMR